MTDVGVLGEWRLREAWVASVGLWLAYHLRHDDGTCNVCGAERRTGYVRYRLDEWWHWVFPDIDRRCITCRFEHFHEDGGGPEDV